MIHDRCCYKLRNSSFTTFYISKTNFMKKTFCLFITLIVLMNFSIAQKTTIGIQAGATFASYKATIENLSATSKTKVGFTAGLALSAPLGKNFSFRPELNFVQKGGKYNEEGYSDKLMLNYIELPLNFVYNTSSFHNGFFIGAGPSFNVGLSGKDKWKDGSESGEDDIKFGSDGDYDFKALEIGLNVLAGYQFSGGFFIAANYNAGLNDISLENAGENTKYHNRYFGIRIGYMFNGSIKAGSESK